MPRCINKCSRTICGLLKVVIISIFSLLRSLFVSSKFCYLAYQGKMLILKIQIKKNKAPYRETRDNSAYFAFVHNIRSICLGYGLLVALKSLVQISNGLSCIWHWKKQRGRHILFYRIVPAGADWSHLTFKQCLLQRSPSIIALLFKVNCQFVFKYYAKALA